MSKLHAGASKATLPGVNPSKDYPVHLGDTFSESSDASFHSLQYKFKPQSAGRSSGGSLQISQNTIALQAPNVQEGKPGVSFEGQWAPAQPEVDCVAFFDGTSWRLELLSGVATNIRHTAGVQPVTQAQRPPSSRPPTADARGGPQRPRADDAKREAVPKPAARGSSASAPPSRTPSVAPPPSTTPSMSAHPSQETSPSPSVEPVRRPAGQSPKVNQAQKRSVEAPQESRDTPSVPPPNSMLEASSSSVTSSDSEDEVVQPSQAAPPPQVPAPEAKKAPAPEKKKAAAADVPDFEREFFADNSDDDNESDDSESSGNLSEEEAKHF